jgi:hypothetical protein
MISKKKNSEENKVQQSISISPALKEWVIRYVKVNNKKYPHDKRFESISAFYTYVLDKIITCFKNGKSLDDFDRFLDKDAVSFYDKLSFKAIKSIYEIIIETNRYTFHDYEAIYKFFLKFRNHFKEYIESKDLYKLKLLLKRLEKYFTKYNILSDMKIDIINRDNFKDPILSLDAVGNYRNICFENTKSFIALFSLLGMELVEFIYSKKNSYFKIDLIPTDLFKTDDITEEARLELYKKNLSLLINLKKVINDKDYYLWMKMANDKGIFVDFSNDFILKKWINLIEDDIKKFSPENEFLISMLKFFERIHWIKIEDDNDLVFEFCFANQGKDKKKQFLLNYFSKFSNIKQMDEKYQLL